MKGKTFDNYCFASVGSVSDAPKFNPRSRMCKWGTCTTKISGYRDSKYCSLHESCGTIRDDNIIFEKKQHQKRIAYLKRHKMLRERRLANV